VYLHVLVGAGARIAKHVRAHGEVARTHAVTSEIRQIATVNNYYIVKANE
jgi:hypothetical protein